MSHMPQFYLSKDIQAHQSLSTPFLWLSLSLSPSVTALYTCTPCKSLSILPLTPLALDPNRILTCHLYFIPVLPTPLFNLTHLLYTLLFTPIPYPCLSCPSLNPSHQQYPGCTSSSFSPFTIFARRKCNLCLTYFCLRISFIPARERGRVLPCSEKT